MSQVRIVVAFIGAFYVYNSIAALISFERSLKGNLDNAEKSQKAIERGCDLAERDDSSEALSNRESIVAMYVFHSGPTKRGTGTADVTQPGKNAGSTPPKQDDGSNSKSGAEIKMDTGCAGLAVVLDIVNSITVVLVASLFLIEIGLTVVLALASLQY